MAQPILHIIHNINVSKG